MQVLVVVPTLGERQQLLRRTLGSLVSQTPQPRVVVVAAGDVKGVQECGRGFEVEVVPQRGKGLSRAVNEGWEHAGATSEAWTWLGDDDELLPHSLARTTEALAARPVSSMVYGRCRYVDAAGQALWTARPGRLAAAVAPYGPNLLPQPGSLLRASAVRQVGLLDPSLRYAMDIDLFLRLRRVGPLVYLPVELALFRWHAASTTVGNQVASQQELERVQAQLLTDRERRWAPVLRPVARLVGQTAYHLNRLKRPRSP